MKKSMYEVIENDHNSIFSYIVEAQADRRDPTSTVSLKTLSFHQIRFSQGVRCTRLFLISQLESIGRL